MEISQLINPLPGLYRYTPLPNDEDYIRLFALAALGDPEDAISGIFVTARRSDFDSDYEALSYTWNGNVKSHGVIVDDLYMCITVNLFAALRRLRSGQPRRLWIDAICINQNDDAEKTIQIAQMSHIFMDARRVVAWIGEDSPDREGKMSFDFCEWFCSPDVTAKREILNYDEHGERRQARQVHELFDAEIDLYCKTYSHPQIGSCDRNILRLLERPWFYRKWVIQEVYLGREVIAVRSMDSSLVCVD